MGKKRIKVAQFKDGKLVREYDGLNDAAKEIGGQQSHISECMRDIPHRHTHKGYEWRNVNDDEQPVTMGETEN